MENSKELVTIEGDEPQTTSYIVAEQLGIAHRNMVVLIKDHQERIEKHFGVLRFQASKPQVGSVGGRPEQFVTLTENQAHYILTLSRNTDKAMEVKALFVKAFAQAKQLLAQSGLDQIAALQQEIAQLRAKEQLLLPERVTDKQATEVLNQLQTMVHEEQLASEMDGVKRYNLEFALHKARGFFQGQRIQVFNVRDKPNQWGEVRIKEYPDETEEDREYRLKKEQHIRQSLKLRERKALEKAIIEQLSLYDEATFEDLEDFVDMPAEMLESLLADLVHVQLVTKKKKGKFIWYSLVQQEEV